MTATPQRPETGAPQTELARRTILAIVKTGTREFVTIEVCDTEEELAAAHAGIREGYTCEVFVLMERDPGPVAPSPWGDRPEPEDPDRDRMDNAELASHQAHEPEPWS